METSLPNKPNAEGQDKDKDKDKVEAKVELEDKMLAGPVALLIYDEDNEDLDPTTNQ